MNRRGEVTRASTWQAALIRREMKTRGVDVHVSTIDDYTGAECEILLLSLASPGGCNSSGACSAGTLAWALSRARTGLYVVGDETALDPATWTPMLSALHEAGAIGGFVPLTAVRKVNGRMAMVRNSEDFDGLCTKEDYARSQPKE